MLRENHATHDYGVRCVLCCVKFTQRLWCASCVMLRDIHATPDYDVRRVLFCVRLTQRMTMLCVVYYVA